MKKTRILAVLVAAVLVVAALCACLTVSAADENVAKGKSYVVSQQFRQGGADAGWGWDDNAPIAYPDDGAKLTDGVIAADDAAYDDDVWAGFTCKAPEYEGKDGQPGLGYSWIRVDLGAEYDLSKLVLYVGTTFLKNGIGSTNMTVSYYKVDDMKGANAELISEETPADVDENTVACISVASDLSTPVTAQYIEIRMVRGGWMFISEFEAYGAKAGGSGTTSKPADDSSAPADDSSAPADDSSAPAATSSTAPATSSTAPATSSTTSKVPTGDAGMIGFAVLALVAVAGVAVAVKVRH